MISAGMRNARDSSHISPIIWKDSSEYELTSKPVTPPVTDTPIVPRSVSVKIRSENTAKWYT